MLLLLDLNVVGLWNIEKTVLWLRKEYLKMINCGKQDLTQFNILQLVLTTTTTTTCETNTTNNTH